MVRILIRHSIYIIFIVVLFFNSCNEIDKNQYGNTIIYKSIPSLVQLGYEHTNDTLFYKICSIINDSVQNNKVDYRISSILTINPDKKEISWDYVYNEDTLVNVNDNLFFKILIKDRNTILANNNLVQKKDIQEFEDEFIYKDNNRKLKKKVVKYFGKVEVPISAIQISINVKKGEKFSIEKWKLFFQSINESITFLENKRNQIAKHKWGTDFNSLNFKKKLAITEIVYFRILINIYYIKN